MMTIYGRLAAFCAGCMLLCGAPVAALAAPPVPVVSAAQQNKTAQDKGAPSRDSLVAFWEDAQQKDPHVSVFKKTDQSGVYDFKTDFFPYSGKLKVLNAVVTHSDDGYYQGLYTGILDVDLQDAKPAFFKKYAASYAAWKRQNYFYYSVKKAAWFPASAWDTYMTDADVAPVSQAVRVPTIGHQGFTTWAPIVVSFLVFGWFLLWARRAGQRAREINARALTAQAEQTELLKKILNTLERGLQG